MEPTPQLDGLTSESQQIQFTVGSDAAESGERCCDTQPCVFEEDDGDDGVEPHFLITEFLRDAPLYVAGEQSHAAIEAERRAQGSAIAAQLGAFARSFGPNSGPSSPIGPPQTGPRFSDIDAVVAERARMQGEVTRHATSFKNSVDGSNDSTMNFFDALGVMTAKLRSEPTSLLEEGEADGDDQINDENVQQVMTKDSHVTEVFDPTFRFCFEVPTSAITHVPPKRLNITRLVFCRNYRTCEPLSCSMGDGCKFVHADVDFRVLVSHPIHVKYSWRNEELCIYGRLPPGEILRVSAPNNRTPIDIIPSERILVTRGSLRRAEDEARLSHCAHYYFNRMCNRGERCNFIHAVHVDPNVVGDYKRAPSCKGKVVVAGNHSHHSSDASCSARNSAASDKMLALMLNAKPFVPNVNPSVPMTPNLSEASPQMQPVTGGLLGASGSQYGMVVFVPCDANQPPVAVSPGMLQPPMAPGLPPSLSMLPAATLELLFAAYPGLAQRWASATGTIDPAAIGAALMNQTKPSPAPATSTTVFSQAPLATPTVSAGEAATSPAATTTTQSLPPSTATPNAHAIPFTPPSAMQQHFSVQQFNNGMMAAAPTVNTYGYSGNPFPFQGAFDNSAMYVRQRRSTGRMSSGFR